MMAGREAKRNNERLEYKFFFEYFKRQHEDLYGEARSFYEKVKKNNPNVRDLTKTIEFVAKTKPNEDIPKYYYRRRAQAAPARPKQTELTMVLNIPLATNPSSQAPIETPSQAPIETNPSSQAPIETNPPSQVIEEEPLILGDDIFHHLIGEIQEDPDLWAIFNNFEIPNMNDDDGMNPQVWNDMNELQNISLSEMEIP